MKIAERRIRRGGESRLSVDGILGQWHSQEMILTDERRSWVGRMAAFLVTAVIAWREQWQAREVVWTFWVSSLVGVILHGWL